MCAADRELDAQDQAMEELDLLSAGSASSSTSEAGPSEEADSPWSTGSINHPIRLSPEGHLAHVLFRRRRVTGPVCAAEALSRCARSGSTCTHMHLFTNSL